LKERKKVKVGEKESLVSEFCGSICGGVLLLQKPEEKRKEEEKKEDK